MSGMSHVATSPLLVVTPWYPTEERPYAGTFVRESVRALAAYVGEPTIVHVENRPLSEDRPPTWRDTPEGRVRWIPVPMDPRTTRGDMMRRQAQALARFDEGLIARASTMHVHVGAPTGAAVASLVGPNTRLVITEHATYLASVFRDPLARQWYRRALRRADVFTAVSEGTAQLIESAFPSAGTVRVIPNPVDMSALPDRARLDTTTAPAVPLPLAELPLAELPRAGLPRWLYVGNLIPHKGVERLVRTFAAWVHSPLAPSDAELTLVGDGTLRGELETLAVRLGVADRIRFAGPVPPEQIGAVYADHDLLVHLSHIETFGLTCVEAAASGMAVVVTRCGAPVDTLAVHAAAGLARFVDVGGPEQVEDVVAAVAELSAGLAALPAAKVSARIALSRGHLERCYGAPAVGARLHRALTAAPEPALSPDAHPRVLMLAATPVQRRRGLAILADVADIGGHASLLQLHPRSGADRGSSTPGQAPSATASVDGLAARGAAVLLGRVPATAWDGLDAVARVAGRRSSRIRLGLGRRIERLRARQRRVSRRVLDGPAERALRRTRWYAAARHEVEQALAGEALTQVDVVVAEPGLLTDAAHAILAAHPHLEVRGDLTRQELAARLCARQNAVGEPQ